MRRNDAPGMNRTCARGLGRCQHRVLHALSRTACATPSSLQSAQWVGALRDGARGDYELGSSSARLHEPGFVGEDDGLGSVVEVKLGEDAGDVGLDGGVADEELAGDVGV